MTTVAPAADAPAAPPGESPPATPSGQDPPAAASTPEPPAPAPFNAGLHPLNPNYALAFRFAVTVGSDELGRWTSCNGLKVSFNPEVFRSGGDYTKAAGFLPGAATYEKITLKRAVYDEGSRNVQAWLAKAAYDWIGGEPDEAGETAQIRLLDAAHKTVMEWTLEGVRPSAWHGPDLDAGGNKVAIESLDLVHTGFRVKVANRDFPRSRDAQTTKFTLAPDSAGTTGTTGPDAAGEVVFLANPTEIAISYSNRGGTAASQGDGDGTSLALTTEVAGVTSYTVSGLMLSGPDTEKQARLLRTWATKLGTGRTKLNLKWGATPYSVIIESLQISYTRFDPQGKPIRAKIGQLKLEDWVENAAGAVDSKAGSGNRNPSSGGIPGRASHTLVLGESLASVAQQTYGNGARWRDIATANGIDDPRRVAPGTVLFLPAPTELNPEWGGHG